MLEHVLLSENSLASNNAFMLLANAPNDTILCLMDHDMLFTRSTDALAHNPPPFLVSRVASLLLAILKVTNNPTSMCVNIFFQLLPFIDNIGVLDLYVNVTQSSSEMYGFHELLVRNMFADLVNLEFENNCSNLKLANLSRIVRHASKNQILGPSFRRDIFVDRLAVLSIENDIFLRNNVWQAISTMTQDDTAKLLRSVVPLALNIITEPFHTVYLYTVCAIDFLMKMLNIENKCEAEFRIRQIEGTFTRLIVQFPDSTNLQSSLFRMIRNAIKWESFGKYLLPLIGPVILDNASANNHSAARMNCIVFLNDVFESGKSFQQQILMSTPGMVAFKKDILKPLFKVLNSNYGGRLPLL